MYHTNHPRLPSLFSGFRLSLSICSLLFAFLLAACSLGGGSTGTAPGTTSGNTPATTPATSVPAQPTSAPTTSLTTYTGNGFTIGYPTGWTVMKEGNGQVMLVDKQADAAQGGVFMIGLNPAGGNIPPATLLQFELPQFRTLKIGNGADGRNERCSGLQANSWDGGENLAFARVLDNLNHFLL